MDFPARDRAVAAFRRRVQSAAGLVPLHHQAEWQLASEGYILHHEPPSLGDFYHEILVTTASLGIGAQVVGTRHVNGTDCSIIRRKITPRPAGCAHVIADLAAYKTGKSYWAALWTAGFGIVPNAKVHIIGFEYSTAEPEFTYLAEFLLSERGLNIKPRVFHNDKRAGRMRLVLPNGAEFEVKSWERKEGLKGKRITAYVYAEAYQLPGLEVYTTLSQNLRELRGYALAPTTPDRPWVGVFHDYGHGDDPDWHCTCSVHGRENPYTFDAKAFARDDPNQGGIMTRERFAIAWEGKLGSFIGHVYPFTRGDSGYYFSRESHPMLFREQEGANAHGGR